MRHGLLINAGLGLFILASSGSGPMTMAQSSRDKMQFQVKAGERAPVTLLNPKEDEPDRIWYEFDDGEWFTGTPLPDGSIQVGQTKDGRPLVIESTHVRLKLDPIKPDISNPKKVFLDLPPDRAVTLRAEPGKSGIPCDTEAGQCVGWPSASNSDLALTETNLVLVEDPETEDQRAELYYRVDATYIPKGKSGPVQKDGWLPARLTRDEPLVIQEEAGRIEDPDCPPPKSDLERQAEELQQVAEEAVSASAEEIAKITGQCLYPPKYGKGSHVIEQTLGRAWAKSASVAGLNRKQLYAIDALARTLYGEMRSCFDNGLHYPEAVATIAMRRALLVQKKGPKGAGPFVKHSNRLTTSSPLEEILPHVLGSEAQFSAWNKDDHNFKVVLCPKKKANKEQQGIWQDSVQIAMNAVLGGEAFVKAHPQLKAFHYTSGIASPWGKAYQKVNAFINGRPLKNKQCMRVWKNEAELKAAGF